MAPPEASWFRAQKVRIPLASWWVLEIELACRRELQKIVKFLTDVKSALVGRRFDDFFNFLPSVPKVGIDFFEKKKRSVRLRDANQPPNSPA